MHWTRADLGVGPEGGPSSPFCPRIFSFVNMCPMVLRALLLNIFSLITLIIRRESVFEAYIFSRK